MSQPESPSGRLAKGTRHRHAEYEDGAFLTFEKMVREGQASHLIWDHGATFRVSNPPRKQEREKMHNRAHRRHPRKVLRRD